MSDYKTLKETFVSNNEGQSVWSINLVCFTALTSYALWLSISTRRRRAATNASANSLQSASLKTVALEFVTLILPLLLALTLLSQHVALLNAVIAFAAFVIRPSSHQKIQATVPANARLTPNNSPTSLHHPRLSQEHVAVSPSVEISQDEMLQTALKLQKKEAPVLAASLFTKSCVTVFRAHMMIMTIIAILAVDFPVFPRVFAKCETWGTSLMDLGVGSFVFSLGLVSAIPLLRSPQDPPLLKRLATASRRSAVVIALGLVRVLLVKGVEYPEHVSEYGVHWNFFFTIGIMPIAGALTTALFRHGISYMSMGSLVAIIHQIILSQTSLQDWTLNATRTSLLSQNKEGLVSLPGYLAIYFFAIDAGTYILPPDPYFAYRKTSVKSKDGKDKHLKQKPGKLANNLTSWAVVWWAVYGAFRLVPPTNDILVSRRLANLPYTIWIVAFNTGFIACYLLLQLAITGNTEDATAPVIFRAINKNSLALFLIANLLTGAVNMSIDTIRTSNGIATIILILYSGLLTASAWLMRSVRLKL